MRSSKTVTPCSFWKCILTRFILAVCIFSSASFAWQDEAGKPFTFIVTADMRYYATEKYRSSQHFLGVLKAIRELGQGEFMVSTGDVDPPDAVRSLISEILGEDYPWYPAPGNHEMDVEKDILWLRNYNAHGKTLPNIVRSGPAGTEELTFSFDWNNCHFVVINQYFDGATINGADGDVIPLQLDWLEKDLTSTDKSIIFVFGHEPIVSIPDMDNGRIRHQGDSLDKYPANAFRFHQLMRRYKVDAYFCGHTHSTSFAQINGIWQLDAGHCRGIEEDSEPTVLFRMATEAIRASEQQGLSRIQAMEMYYRNNKKQVQKALFSMNIAGPSADYRDIPDSAGITGFRDFYNAFEQDGAEKDRLYNTFWKNCGYRKSSFFKVIVRDENVNVEIYRDDAHGGKYTLHETLSL